MSQKIFDSDLDAMRNSKVTLTLNKPAYVDRCILDLSKGLMYEFHYDYIKSKYGNKSRLLFSDTDRLMHEIKTKNVYEDFSKDKKCLILAKSKFNDILNKLVVGKIKDETVSIPMKEFVGW